MPFSAAIPYQDLPDLPPRIDVETRPVLKAALAASRALASLNMACRNMPDPTLLINLTPLIEAQASSELENIVTTNDDLFKAASGALDKHSPAIKEALRYREALKTGYDLIQDRPLSSQTALAVCSTLHGAEVTFRSHPGTYIGNPYTKEQIYTPPTGHTLIQEKMYAWEQFIHNFGDLDPLVAMALQHYQFEAIHPFSDGNGRTGRILNLLCLKEFELLDLPVLYLSGYLVRHKDLYYELLRAVTEQGHWQEWIIFMLEAVAHSAESALSLVDNVVTHRDSLESSIRAKHPTFQPAALARILTKQPYARIDDVVSAGLAQRQTASKWLRTLTEDGMLHSEKIGRQVIFINTTLVNSLFGNGLVSR